MNFSLIEDKGDVKVAYDSILVPPRKMNIFNSDLSLQIINELVKEPGCAMDLARKMGQHEQKIYYHLRKMENVGIIRMTGTEKRYGMSAKIYSVVSPVISTKLFDDGHEIEKKNRHSLLEDKNVQEFLSPFIKNGNLNATVVIGDPYSHGRFDKSSHEGPYAFDIAMFFGGLLKEFRYPHYKLDTEVTGADLKGNLILIGNQKSNVIIDKINDKLPIYFDTEKDFKVVSRETKKSYNDPRVGVVMKINNPSNPKKKILVLGGIGSRGSRSVAIAFTENMKKITERSNNGNVKMIVKGFDRSGDRIIDDIEILE